MDHITSFQPILLNVDFDYEDDLWARLLTSLCPTVMWSRSQMEIKLLTKVCFTVFLQNMNRLPLMLFWTDGKLDTVFYA